MIRKSVIMLALLLVLTTLGFAGRTQADGTPTPDPMMMDMGGTPMPPDEHNHSSRLDANGAVVKIISPEDSDVLKSDSVIVRIETLNWPLGEAGHHWHLYVNGKEQGMSQGNNPALQARDLQPGENSIEVVLSNELHQELNATHQIAVRYEPTNTAAAASAPGLSAGVVITLVLVTAAVSAILVIGFAWTRKKA